MKDGKVVILIIDDDVSAYGRILERQLPQSDVEILSTIELEEGRRLFQERKDEIDIIVIDHQVIGGTTPDLVREIKASGFKGRLIGVTYGSSKPLIEAGVDYVCDRNRLFNDELLGIPGNLPEEIQRIKKEGG